MRSSPRSIFACRRAALRILLACRDGDQCDGFARAFRAGAAASYRPAAPAVPRDRRHARHGHLRADGRRRGPRRRSGLARVRRRLPRRDADSHVLPRARRQIPVCRRRRAVLAARVQQPIHHVPRRLRRDVLGIDLGGRGEPCVLELFPGARGCAADLARAALHPGARVDQLSRHRGVRQGQRRADLHRALRPVLGDRHRRLGAQPRHRRAGTRVRVQRRRRPVCARHQRRRARVLRDHRLRGLGQHGRGDTEPAARLSARLLHRHLDHGRHLHARRVLHDGARADRRAARNESRLARGRANRRAVVPARRVFGHRDDGRRQHVVDQSHDGVALAVRHVERAGHPARVRRRSRAAPHPVVRDRLHDGGRAGARELERRAHVGRHDGVAAAVRFCDREPRGAAAAQEPGRARALSGADPVPRARVRVLRVSRVALRRPRRRPVRHCGRLAADRHRAVR